jgi:chorismate synthase
MPANTFGEIFRVSTFGESHGKAVGVLVDGCPAGLELSENDIQPDLSRRRPGQSAITTQRDEKDQVQILSGVFEGKTTGVPIMMLVWNQDQKSEDYNNLKDLIRPSHADFTYNSKYGNRDHRGGGRSSARIMIGRVAAGAIAKKFLAQKFGMEFLAFTDQVGSIKAENLNFENITSEQIESNLVRCPDLEAATRMIELIEKVRDEKDSIGGCIRGLIRNCPVGLGEPEFDKLPAVLAHAMLSINATKGFEFGSGFGGVSLRGSEHNDEFYKNSEGKVSTKTNHAGGTLGGISNGQTIDFRVAIKPVATIAKSQSTLDKDRNEVTFEGKGRHDPCVLPRAVPIVEAMAALVIMDLYLRNLGKRV